MLITDFYLKNFKTIKLYVEFGYLILNILKRLKFILNPYLLL